MAAHGLAKLAQSDPDTAERLLPQYADALGMGDTERGQGLFLTPKARAALTPALAAIARLDDRALGELSRTERANLLDELGEVIAGLRSAD